MHSDNLITFFKLRNLIHMDLDKNPKSHTYGGLTPLHSSHPTSVSESKLKGKKENQNKIVPFPFLFKIKMSICLIAQ